MDAKHILFLKGNVTMVAMEWLPIGRHTVTFLQDKLQCTRVTENFFVTSSIDHDRNAAVINVAEAEVRLKVEGYEPLESLRFSAKIDIADTGSDQQEELIGVEVTRDGKLSYGLKLDEREDAYSIDELSLILADLIEDSSRVMDTILNSYQKRLLDIVYCEQSSQRDKFCIIMADTIDPSVRDVQDLFNKPAYRSELRQLLGHGNPELYYQGKDGAMIVMGENGVLLLGKEREAYLTLLKLYGVMGSIIHFQNNIFSRLSWSWDLLYEQKRIVREEDIDKIMDIQNTLSNLSADQGLLLSAPEYIEKAISYVCEQIDTIRSGEHSITSQIEFFKRKESIFRHSGERVQEAERDLHTLGREIDNIRLLASTLNEKQVHGINRAMNILTVVSVIVLPLSLITGIYGMNFYRVQPIGDTFSPYNMPELYWKYGYFIVLGSMVGIAMLMWAIFNRLGLFSNMQKNKKRKR